MPEIVLQFSTSTAWQSAIIRSLCGSPFSHSDWVMEDGNLLGASDSPDAPIINSNPIGNSGGVAIRPPEYQEFHFRRRAIFSATEEQYRQFSSLLISQLGKGFDHEALKASSFLNENPFSREWRQTDLWFCSELITWALEEAGWFTVPLMIGKNRISPTSLLSYIWFSPNMTNREEFWTPPKGIKLGAKELEYLKGAEPEKIKMMFHKGE